MEEYLQSTKAALASGTVEKVHAVLGNEACDLDSAISALVYGYYLHKTHSNNTSTLYIPVLNIPRADYVLRTEVKFYHKKFKVNPDDMTFRDDLDLEALHKDAKLALTLVDHNVMVEADSSLDSAVVGVVDHHRRDRPETDKESQVIETVGSCCTLVAEKLINDASFQMEQQVADMLYGVIVLDTINLSESAGIKTPKDIAILDQLEALRPEGSTSRDDVYEQLDSAKADVSDISTTDLLRKDMKALSSADLKVVFCSVPVALEIFFESDDLMPSLSTFATHQGASVIVLMSLKVISGDPVRQLAVYSEDDNLRHQTEDLLNSADPPLELTPFSSPSVKISAFHQGNFKASRKKILPHVKAKLSTLHRSETTLSSPSEDSGVALLDFSISTAQDSTILDTPAEVKDPFGLVDLSGVTTQESSTEEGIVSTLIPEIQSAAPAQVDDLLGLDFNDSAKTGVVEGVTTTESTTDLLGGSTTSEEKPKEDVAQVIGDLLSLDLNDSSKTGRLQGATTSESTTDPETPTLDEIPDSVKPGGLLDLDYFAPKNDEDNLSDDASIGSLDDYAKDDEPKGVPENEPKFENVPQGEPVRSEQEVVDLLSDALHESPARSSSVSPETPNTADLETKDEKKTPELVTLEPEKESKIAEDLITADTSITSVEVEKGEKSTDFTKDISNTKEEEKSEDNVTNDKPGIDLLDPLEHHQGVLIDASPIGGRTPDPSATPDTVSQPTSPPNTSYPGTPPNSYIDGGIMEGHHQSSQQHLPSFMNADMVRRIQEKKAMLSVIDEPLEQNKNPDEDRFPFTPQNSVSDSSLDHLTRLESLPSFDNAEIVHAVSSKRSNQFGEDPTHITTSEAMKFPYAPPNSYAESSLSEMHKHGGPPELFEQDFADRISKKQLPSHQEEDTLKSPLEEIQEMELPTVTTGNKVAFRIAGEMKVEEEYREVHDLVNDHSGNVVANRIAQDLKSANEYAEITERNAARRQLTIEENDLEATPPEHGIWEKNTVRYTGDDEVDVANQFAAEVLQKAMEDIGVTGESLQSELAKATANFTKEPSPAITLTGADKQSTTELLSHVQDDHPTAHFDDETKQKDSIEHNQQTKSAFQQKSETSSTKPEGGAHVSFGDEPKLTIISPDLEYRPHSDSQNSGASSGGDSDLSWSTRDFVARMRSDTGASVLSGNSDDLVMAAHEMEVARQVVDTAMAEAVDIVKEDEENEVGDFLLRLCNAM